MTTKTTTKKAMKTTRKATPKKAPAKKKPARANTAATDAKATPKATNEAKSTRNATRANDVKPDGDKPKAKKRIGILDAAAHILAETGGAMSCKAIVNIAIESGVWETTGKTPAATLYAAITREIAKKGKDARFKKVDRGLFELNTTSR
jgi:hypothetical protein